MLNGRLTRKVASLVNHLAPFQSYSSQGGTTQQPSDVFPLDTTSTRWSPHSIHGHSSFQRSTARFVNPVGDTCVIEAVFPSESAFAAQIARRGSGRDLEEAAVRHGAKVSTWLARAGVPIGE